MAVAIYKISVPIFVQFGAVLDKAAARCEAKKIDLQFMETPVSL